MLEDDRVRLALRDFYDEEVEEAFRQAYLNEGDNA
jgi:hypothetical protein